MLFGDLDAVFVGEGRAEDPGITAKLNRCQKKVKGEEIKKTGKGERFSL